MVKIADMPIDERPRERMARSGAAALSDAEVVALLIEPGVAGRSSLAIARELLAEGLSALVRRDWTPGKRAGSLGPARVARIGAALELGRRVAALPAPTSEPISDPADVAPRLIARYGHRVQEVLGGIFLNGRDRIILEREIYVGTLTSAAALPRDVLRIALEVHAASVIVFHNHPSGDPKPSEPDRDFTLDLVEAGRVMGVPIRDHLVIAAHGFVSMQKRGWS